MPACSIARVSALAVRTSIASRDVGSTPATSRFTSAARMPLPLGPAVGRLAVGQADAVAGRAREVALDVGGRTGRPGRRARAPAPSATAIFGLQERREGLGLAVGQQDGVVVRGPPALPVGPGPGAGVPLDPARPALDLDQPEALLGQDQQIDLVDGPVGGLELEVGPGAVRARGRAGRRGRSPGRPAPTGTARA